MFKNIKRNWLIAGGISNAKLLGIDVVSAFPSGYDAKNQMYAGMNQMIDEIGINTKDELASMIIVSWVPDIKDPHHLMILTEYFEQQFNRNKMSEMFAMNIMNEIATQMKKLRIESEQEENA